jgi:hypothetical protein
MAEMAPITSEMALVADVPEERREPGTTPTPTWTKANPRQAWTLIAIGAGGVLIVEVTALAVWGVILIS